MTDVVQTQPAAEPAKVTDPAALLIVAKSITGPLSAEEVQVLNDYVAQNSAP